MLILLITFFVNIRFESLHVCEIDRIKSNTWLCLLNTGQHQFCPVATVTESCSHMQLLSC